MTSEGKAPNKLPIKTSIAAAETHTIVIPIFFLDRIAKIIIGAISPVPVKLSLASNAN